MLDHKIIYNNQVGSTRFVSNGSFLQQDQNFCSGFPQGRLDLTLSTNNASDYNVLGNLHQESNGWHDTKPAKLMDFDLNEDQPDESSFRSNDPVGPNLSSDFSCSESCTTISTSLTFKSQTSKKDDQTKTFTIDLESIPEPSSHLPEENKIKVTIPKPKQEIEEKISKKNTKTNKQSSSIDSYESLVLKIEESNVDEDSATSKAAFEINEYDEKRNGIKLKRGRRMKDFRKEILPTLSALSKHEIWEDIKLLEGVIRSKEYKRLNKAKTINSEKWFTPVKSKRSK